MCVTISKFLKVSELTSWQGLRGIASIFVVASHVILSFSPHLVLPANSSNGPVDLFQRPILRLISQGPAWVALFFVLSGYVNALKPIKQARAGSIDNALTNLASSSFRRTGRLVLPAAAATVISWLLCQFGAYEIARASDAPWIRDTSALRSEPWSAAVLALLKNIAATWIFGHENKYDQPQWALIFLFKGSMLVFMTLLATVSATARWRMIVVVVMYAWSWASGDCKIPPNSFFP